MQSKFIQFLSYYKPYVKTFSVLMVTALFSSLVSLAIPLCTRYITSDVLALAAGEAANAILYTGAVMAGLMVLELILVAFTDYQGHVMGAKMERDIRGALFTHYQKHAFQFFDNRKVGELMSRLTNDLQNLAEFYHHGPEDLMFFSVRFFGAFAIMFMLNPSLALIVAVFMPPMAIFTVLVGKKMRAACKKGYESVAEVNVRAEDSLSGIRVVKAFAAEERELQKFSLMNEKFFKSRKTIYKYECICYEGMQTFIRFITVAVVMFGGLAISQQTLSLPDLIAFILYVNYVTEPITHLIHMMGQFQDGYASFERFQDMMELNPEICDPESPLPLKKVQGEVQFVGVSFGYGEGGGPVLKEVNLRIRKGEHVALVGHSGVGKTTFCALIPRFYDVTQGSILIDGIDVRQVAQKELHQNIGVVEQTVYLFAGSVFENIAYGKPNATVEEVVAAAKSAGAHDFITALPKGYDTDIGVRGVKLSGGQKQRLSIARAFLKNPAILIFDEATSALDSESEAVVHASMARLTKGRTTFVIAHRLSTIKNCHRILFIEDGGIAEEGDHATLMAQGGRFAELVTRQQLGI